MNVKNAISKVKTGFNTRVVPAVISAGTAISAAAITASASSGGTTNTVDYSSLKTSILSAVNTIITNCVDVAVAILPLGLGLWGLGKIWDVAKKFFVKTTN